MLGQQPAYCKKKSFQIGISTLIKVSDFLCLIHQLQVFANHAVNPPHSRGLCRGTSFLEVGFGCKNAQQRPHRVHLWETFSGATGPTYPHCQHAAWLDPWKTGWRKICWSSLTRRYRTSQPELELIWPVFSELKPPRDLNIYWKPLVVE